MIDRGYRWDNKSGKLIKISKQEQTFLKDVENILQDTDLKHGIILKVGLYQAIENAYRKRHP